MDLYVSMGRIFQQEENLMPNSQYFPPDIENGVQLLQIIQKGIECRGQVALLIWPKLYYYWGIERTATTTHWVTTTPIQTVKPKHVVLLMELGLIQIEGMGLNELLVQHALGTLEGKIIIKIPDQLT